MRYAFHKKEFLYDGNVIYGVNLGYDYAAEHEWGISKLNRLFGINDQENVFGIAKRQINTLPSRLKFQEAGKYMLSCAFSGYDDYMLELSKEEQEISSAWSGSDFFVASSNSFIKELYQAFLDLDVLMGVGASVVFDNGGLILAIASKYPFKDEMYEKDRAYHELQQRARDTGIYQLLENTGKKYYDLFPHLEDNKLRFWLNPQDQQKYRYGWFDLEDLKEWACDRGRVLK